MNDTALISDVRKKICSEIEIEPLGRDRYVVYTPFMFDDGDHFVVVLRKDPSGWFFTDEGHTLMHLSYSDVETSRGGRAKIIEESLASHGIVNNGGELRISVPDDSFGDALYSYLQGISRVASVTQWKHERIASTFMEDFLDLLSSVIPQDRSAYDWHHPTYDPDGTYSVDCRINGQEKPWFIFGIGSDDKCRDATIACLMFEKWTVPFRSVALFEDQTEIGRKPLAQLSNVVGRQFSSLGDRDRITAYLREEVLRLS